MENIKGHLENIKVHLDEVASENKLIYEGFKELSENVDKNIDNFDNAVSGICIDYLRKMNDIQNGELVNNNRILNLKCHYDVFVKFQSGLRNIMKEYNDIFISNDNLVPTICYNDNIRSNKLNLSLINRYHDSYYYNEYYSNRKLDNGDIYIDHDSMNEDLIIKYMKEDNNLIDHLHDMNFEDRFNFLKDLEFFNLPIKTQYLSILGFNEDNKIMNEWKNKMVMVNGNRLEYVSKELRRNDKLNKIYNEKLLKDIHYNHEDRFFAIDISMNYFEIIEDYLSHNRKWDSKLLVVQYLTCKDIINEMVQFGIELNENEKNELENAWIRVRRIYINGNYNQLIDECLKKQNQFVSTYLNNIKHEKLHNDGYLYINLSLNHLDIIEQYLNNDRRWKKDYLFVKKLKYSDILNDLNVIGMNINNTEELKKEWMKQRQIYVNENYTSSFDQFLKESDRFISLYEKNIENEHRDEHKEIFYVNIHLKYLDLICNYLSHNNTLNIEMIKKFTNYRYVELKKELNLLRIQLTNEELGQLKLIDESYIMFPESKLLDKKYDHYFGEWLGHEHEWKCVYRASEHKYTTKSFHECCDDVGPTFIVIQFSDGELFGGYTTRSWKKGIDKWNYEIKTDNKIFFFSIENTDSIDKPDFIDGFDDFRWNAYIEGPIYGDIDDSDMDDMSDSDTEIYGLYDFKDSSYDFTKHIRDPKYKLLFYTSSNEPQSILYCSVSDYEVFAINDFENYKETNHLSLGIQGMDMIDEPLLNPSQLLPGTRIVDTKYDDYLIEWLDNDQWKLIYRASEHDYTAKSFHEYCDDKGPTLIIIKSHNGYIFGGYTTQSWEKRAWDTDSKSLLFTLYNAHGVAPTRYHVLKNRGGIECHQYYGPIFCSKDGYHDICINYNGKNCNLKDSCYIGNDSSFGYGCDPKYERSLFVNTNDCDDWNWFSVSDYEVFSMVYATNFNPSLYLQGTKIVDQKSDKYLKEWLGNEYKWKLIYRTSEHGYTAKSFHEYCDDVGPTLIVIKSNNGYIFGGYTTKSWSGGDEDEMEYKEDNDAFIFSLCNPHGVPPTRYNTLKNRGGIDCDPNFGPLFCSEENWWDICINKDDKNCNEICSCYVNNDGTNGYECDPKYRSSLFVDTDEPDDYNCFSVSDYEVFAIDSNNTDMVMKTIEKPLVTPSNILHDTKIVDSKYDKYLVEWLGSEYEWKCIYRTSEHGYTGKSFHEYCDDVGPTLIVIMSHNGYIFGGYTTKSWKKEDIGLDWDDKQDNDAFIFTLKNAHGVIPTRYNALNNVGGINCRVDWGPIFHGNGFGDICINWDSMKCNEGGSCITNNGIGGYECDSKYKMSLFVNTNGPDHGNEFSVLDYEVFAHK